MTKCTPINLYENEINILVVEDEVILAMSMEISLEKMGYYVSGIETDALSAVNHAKRNRPDIILMDINLGDSSGIKAANEIWKTLKIPIIFLTSYTNDKTINEALECEPYGYLIKPCKDKELKATIKMAIHKHKYFFSNQKNTSVLKDNYIFIGKDLKFNKNKAELYKNSKKIKLTKNEKKLFEVMTEKIDEVISFEQISAYIWREELYDRAKLRMLIYRLRQKLGINPFENFYESGYKLKARKEIA